MNKEEFLKELKKINIELNKEQENKLDIYASFLLEYNEHTNLTAIKTLEGTYLKHFYDSLTLIKAYDLTKEINVLDIGTGAGFPGLVLKIVYPNLNITLLDSNNKKTKFLSECIEKLNLENVTVINKRAEEFAKENKEKFDLVTSRAVAHLRVLTELSLPFLKKNGYFIPMKSDYIKELEESKKTIEVLGGKLENVINFKLPLEDSNRNILIIKKIDETPKIYPRTYDRIIKKPIK